MEFGTFRLFTILTILFFLVQTGCFLNSKIQGLDSSSTGINSDSAKPAVADPIDVIVSEIFSTQGRVSWAMPTTDTSVTSYKIIFSSTANPEKNCTAANATATQALYYNVSFLLPNTTYYFRICSLSSSGSSSEGVTGTFKTLKLITRAAAYSGFPNWNDYVLKNGTRFYNATGAVCTTTNIYDFAPCINAGLVQKIVIPQVIACNRIRISDDLDVFKWNCEVSGSDTILYSTDVKPAKGLQDLIYNNQFKNNFIKVKVDGVLAYTSVPEKWWANVIEDLPDSTSTVNLTNGGQTSGKIFTVNANKSAFGYLISEPNISIVVMRGAELKTDSVATSYLVGASNLRFLWIEGQFNGNLRISSVVSFNNVANSRLNNIEISYAGGSGYLITSSLYNSVVSDFHFHHASTAIYNTGYTSNAFNLYYNGRITDSTSDGATYLNNSTMMNVVISNTSGSNMISYPRSLRLLNVTLANSSTSYGLRAPFQGYSLLHNILGLNAANVTFYSFQGRKNTFSQLLAGGATGAAIGINQTAEDHKFTNNIVVETGANCSATNNTAFSPGLVINTCANHGPYSDAVATIGAFDFTKFIVGKITTTDSVNGNNILGLSPFSSILNWSRFQNNFRLWGQDGATFPGADTKSTCASGNCKIWDFRLKADPANLAFNSNHLVTSKNAPFVAGSTCPAAVAGSRFTTHSDDGNAIVYTFLTSAVEIEGDGFGNENGLCESNEECLYSPNFGAYQGEGDYREAGTCTFQDGTITGVKLYAYPTNGI